MYVRHLLVQQGTLLGLFPVPEEFVEESIAVEYLINHAVLSKFIMDLSEQSLKVTVRKSVFDIEFGWSISVPRHHGIVMIYFGVCSREARDAWVTSLRRADAICKSPKKSHSKFKIAGNFFRRSIRPSWKQRNSPQNKCNKTLRVLEKRFDSSDSIQVYSSEEDISGRFMEHTDDWSVLMKDYVSVDAVCPVCLEESRIKDCDALSCGHSFCKSCWTGFVQTTIREGAGCLSARCMSQECPLPLSHGFIKKYAGKLFERYEMFSLNSLIERNENVSWCPRRDCGRAIEWKTSTWSSNKAASCLCGLEFCFDCKAPNHFPATCQQAIMWGQVLLELDDLSEIHSAPRMNQELALAKRWVIKNTKPCPKCSVPIEKSHGCNHMNCQKCSHQFCWICFGDWSDHGTETGGFFKCNRTERIVLEPTQNLELSELELKAQEERTLFSEQIRIYENAQVKVKRVKLYLWYHDFHRKLGEDANETLRHVQSAPSEHSIQFLARAVILLKKCRLHLSWSFVISYFMTTPEIMSEFMFSSSFSATPITIIDGPHVALFNFIRARLEQIVDQLQNSVDSTLELIKLLSKPSQKKRLRSDIGALRKFEDTLNVLSCQVLDHLSLLVSFSEELKTSFPRLADPTHLVDVSISEFKIQGSDMLERWSCDCCGYENHSSQVCKMCNSKYTKNLFARYRRYMCLKVRNCVSCNAEVKLPKQFIHPCSCGQSLGLDGDVVLSKPSKHQQIAGSMEYECIDCSRNVFQVAPIPTLRFLTNPSDVEETFKEKDRSLAPKSDVSLFQCAGKHPLEECKAGSKARSCDACTGDIASHDMIVLCELCNWIICLPCARIYGTMKRSKRAGFKRRNAVVSDSGWQCSQCTYWNVAEGTCQLCSNTRSSEDRDLNSSNVESIPSNRLNHSCGTRDSFIIPPLLYSSVLVSSCLSSSRDITDEKRCCITILKPIKRHSKRFVVEKLRTGACVEIYWETYFVEVEPVNYIRIGVYASIADRSILVTESDVLDSGICQVKIPEFERLIEDLPGSNLNSEIDLWISLSPIFSDGVAEDHQVSTSTLHFVY